jgi:iron complex transport system substrate-binding protein
VVRRLLSVLAGLVLACSLAACGSSDDPSAGSSGTPATRTVAHAMGTTEVPADPQRVVVLDTGELDSVLALGVTPVGATSPVANGPLPSYLTDRTTGVTNIGTQSDLNLETIAGLQPDLILSNKVRHEALYPQLSAIAPTVFAERVGVAWRENLQVAGQALGREAEAERILADYRAKAKETGERFAPGTTISMVRFTGGSVRLYGEGSFIGTILADAGLARPASQRVPGTFAEVSAEQIGQADGDRLFYASYGAAGGKDKASVLGGPLWPGIPAVAEGRSHEVSDDLWYSGIGPIAADQVLDELGTHATA